MTRTLPAYNHLLGADRWSTFSLAPRKEEEIEFEILRNIDDICISYICTKSRLSCEFIERLLVLTTGLLKWHNINSDFDKVKKLIDHIYFSEPGSKPITVIISDDCGNPMKVSSYNVSDRVDWKAVSMFQSLTPEFIKKYIRYLDKSLLLSRQVLDDEMKRFVKLHINDIAYKYPRRIKEEDAELLKSILKHDNEEQLPKEVEKAVVEDKPKPIKVKIEETANKVEEPKIEENYTKAKTTKVKIKSEETVNKIEEAIVKPKRTRTKVEKAEKAITATEETKVKSEETKVKPRRTQTKSTEEAENKVKKPKETKETSKVSKTKTTKIKNNTTEKESKSKRTKKKEQ